VRGNLAKITEVVPCPDLPLAGAGAATREWRMLFYAFYIFALVVLILHFTGWLKRNNLEWLVLVLAVATFPAVIFL